ncbi:MAG: hypothetical protein ACRDXX_03440 [Stackebrandtia sp.]
MNNLDQGAGYANHSGEFSLEQMLEIVRADKATLSRVRDMADGYRKLASLLSDVKADSETDIAELEANFASAGGTVSAEQYQRVWDSADTDEHNASIHADKLDQTADDIETLAEKIEKLYERDQAVNAAYIEDPDQFGMLSNNTAPRDEGAAEAGLARARQDILEEAREVFRQTDNDYKVSQVGVTAAEPKQFDGPKWYGREPINPPGEYKTAYYASGEPYAGPGGVGGSAPTASSSGGASTPDNGSSGPQLQNPGGPPSPVPGGAPTPGGAPPATVPPGNGGVPVVPPTGVPGGTPRPVTPQPSFRPGGTPIRSGTPAPPMRGGTPRPTATPGMRSTMPNGRGPAAGNMNGQRSGLPQQRNAGTPGGRGGVSNTPRHPASGNAARNNAQAPRGNVSGRGTASGNRFVSNRPVVRPVIGSAPASKAAPQPGRTVNADSRAGRVIGARPVGTSKIAQAQLRLQSLTNTIANSANSRTRQHNNWQRAPKKVSTRVHAAGLAMPQHSRQAQRDAEAAKESQKAVLDAQRRRRRVIVDDILAGKRPKPEHVNDPNHWAFGAIGQSTVSGVIRGARGTDYGKPVTREDARPLFSTPGWELRTDDK